MQIYWWLFSCKAATKIAQHVLCQENGTTVTNVLACEQLSLTFNGQEHIVSLLEAILK